MAASDSEKISVIETKVDMFIDEMREQNRMRAAEIRAMDEKFSKLQEQTDRKILNLQEQTDKKILKLQEQTDEKFSKIQEKLDSMGKSVTTLAVTAMIGIGAMAAAVVGIAYSVISKM